MPKKKTILQSEFPYHLSARCINQEWFDIPMEAVWSIVSDYLFFLHHSFNFKIHSFVLMNNHFHMLVTTPDGNLSEGMNYFMREVSRQIAFLAGRINQTFGAPYHWCIVDSHSYYLNAYKYVYRNPVDAGLVLRCEDYKYSSLGYLLGRGHLTYPIQEDSLLFASSCQRNFLYWLNHGSEEDRTEIRKALRKSVFRFGKKRGVGNSVRDENYIY